MGLKRRIQKKFSGGEGGKTKTRTVLALKMDRFLKLISNGFPAFFAETNSAQDFQDFFV